MPGFLDQLGNPASRPVQGCGWDTSLRVWLDIYREARRLRDAEVS